MDRETACAILEPKRVQFQKDAAARAAQRQRYGIPLKIKATNGMSSKSDAAPERNVYNCLWYPSSQQQAPLYIDIHGGGFCWGRVDDGDGFCHRVVERLDWAAVSFDYPLTPAAHYPEPVKWLWNALEAFKTHADELGFNAKQLVVGGRSAGGNLAAALCMYAAETDGTMPIGQVLDHPFLDLAHVLPGEGRYDGPHALAPELLDTLVSAYATEAERTLPTCSPLLASQELIQKMPPAIIQTCEWDSLQGDGEQYAQRLQDAGIAVQYHCYPGVYHGFTEFPNENQIPGQDWLIDRMPSLLAGTK